MARRRRPVSRAGRPRDVLRRRAPALSGGRQERPQPLRPRPSRESQGPAALPRVERRHLRRRVLRPGDRPLPRGVLGPPSRLAGPRRRLDPGELAAADGGRLPEPAVAGRPPDQRGADRPGDLEDAGPGPGRARALRPGPRAGPDAQHRPRRHEDGPAVQLVLPLPRPAHAGCALRRGAAAGLRAAHRRRAQRAPRTRPSRRSSTSSTRATAWSSRTAWGVRTP